MMNTRASACSLSLGASVGGKAQLFWCMCRRACSRPRHTTFHCLFKTWHVRAGKRLGGQTPRRAGPLSGLLQQPVPATGSPNASGRTTHSAGAVAAGWPLAPEFDGIRCGGSELLWFPSIAAPRRRFRGLAKPPAGIWPRWSRGHPALVHTPNAAVGGIGGPGSADEIMAAALGLFQSPGIVPVSKTCVKRVVSPATSLRGVES